jgi:hypothetical protein
VSALIAVHQGMSLRDELVRFGKSQSFVSVMALDCMFDILDDHLVQAEDTFLRTKQVFADRDGYCYRDVLMLGNCLDFTFVEVAASNKVSL